ncbi:MAG: hypothetical protein KGH60_01845 [Candidatus Micrarchaeota archaeon]|nr:hypothetical protein [Candidatus Micrarchaeota archaeon]
MSATRNNSDSRELLVSKMVCEYVLARLNEKCGNAGDITDTIIKIFSRHCPETNSSAIRGLFESMSLENSQIGLSPEGLMELAKEESERYEINKIVTQMLNKLNGVELAKLNNEVARAGRKGLETPDLQELEIKCRGLCETISPIVKRIGLPITGLTPHEAADRAKAAARLDELANTLAKIPETYKKDNKHDPKIKMRLAQIRLRDTAATVNGFITTLEQSGILRNGDMSIQLPTDQNMPNLTPIGMEKTFDRPVLKDHPLRI